MGRSIYFKHVDDELRDINPTLKHVDDELMDINPTSIWGWGLINGIHWRYSMKRMLLPYKGNNHVKVKGHTIPSYDDEEHQKLLNTPVDQSTKNGGRGSTKKRSIKDRLKNLLAYHSTKERNKRPSEKCNNWEHPIIFIPGKLQDPRKKNATEESGERFTKLKDKESSKGKMDEFANVLEILQVDKRLFLEILQNANDGIRKSSSLPPSNAKAKLMKSGSFPSANLSHGRSLKPSKLKDKQSVLKWEKFPDDATGFAENIRGVMLSRALSLVLERTTGSDQEKQGEEVLPSQETNQGKDTDERCGEIKVDQGGVETFRKSSETDEDMLWKNAFAHRRSVSLTESLNKYVVLFENNFGKEEGKLPSSRSLRLRNEDEIKAYKNTPRLFSRIRSLSNLDLYSSFQYDEETNFADWPITSTEEIASCTNEDSKGEVKDVSFSEKIQPDDFHDTGSEDIILEKSDYYTYQIDDLAGECSATVEDCTEPTVSERNTTSHTSSTDKFQQSYLASASESSFEDGVATIDDFQSVEGLENRCDNIDEESSFNFFPGSIGDTVNTDDLEISKSLTEIDYIRHILEFSGFTRDAPHWEWYSPDQPLKPSLFDEACRPHDLESFIEDLGSFYYYQLLFHLVNEELVRLLDGSSTYYPKQLSYSCRIRAFPAGNHMLEEIGFNIGQLLNFKPDEKPSVDSIIDFDLRKDESWMNLQYESESVALEVDHMIFDDLLKEIVC